MGNFRWFIAGLGALVLAGLNSNSVSAQAPAPAPPPTLWQFLGIPQGVNKIQDATLNSSGNNPGLERTPPLTSIADPANLKSSDPAIQAAAKIKQQQDQAPQKIKAIKYLATVGCGCYQKMGVRDALVDALDDCTEEVRYEAALALAKVAGDHCANCGETCCNAKVMNKLKELAEGTDERCCPKETSQRVREAACRALNACRQKLPARNVTPIEGPRPIEAPKGGHIESSGDQSNPTPTPAKPIPIPSPPTETKPLMPIEPIPANPVPATPIKAKLTFRNIPLSGWDAATASASGSKTETEPSANKTVVQTSASAGPQAPVRLRLVIGGEDSDSSCPQVLEASDGSGR